MKRLLMSLAVVVMVAGSVFFFVLSGQVDRQRNRVLRPPPYHVSPRAQRLHEHLLIADLHADTLLWNRDLLAHNSRGHVDVPRLLAGNVALQVFSAVTKVPRGTNLEKNHASSDYVTLLAIADRWPAAARTSLLERALYQASRLNDAATRSQGQLVVIRSAADLGSYLRSRPRQPAMVAGLLSIEGAHALEGKPENIEPLFSAGYRLVGLAHFFDNEFAGSAHGVRKSGLTEKGRMLIREMEKRQMIVDVSHASSPTIQDIAVASPRPMLASHTGVRGTCNNARNLRDGDIRAIAKNGGLIGIGYWRTAICGDDPKAIARAIRYTANLVGAQHVALGSDFDGSITAPFDASGLAQVTEALLAEGFSEEEIRLIMGENVIRLLSENLPQD